MDGLIFLRTVKHIWNEYFNKFVHMLGFQRLDTYLRKVSVVYFFTIKFVLVLLMLQKVSNALNKTTLSLNM